MNCNNAPENQNHIEAKYKEGDKVLMDKSSMKPKLDVLCNGPYLVNKVWPNAIHSQKRYHIGKNEY